MNEIIVYSLQAIIAIFDLSNDFTIVDKDNDPQAEEKITNCNQNCSFQLEQQCFVDKDNDVIILVRKKEKARRLIGW